MDRAHSLFVVKQFDDERRIVSGFASTPSTDRVGDVVVPQGVKAMLPLPLLWQHDPRQPVGHVTEMHTTDEGIQVTCQFATVDSPPSLKDELERAWQQVKAKLVRGFSIGFRPLESEPIKGTSGRRFKSWELLELSCVTVPANADCTIQTIKNFDTLAALGPSTPSGASGKSVKALPMKPPEGQTMNIQEQIKAFTATRAAKVAAMDDIMKASADKGETLDEAQSQTYDDLQVEVETLDKHLKRLRAHEASVATQAVAVPTQPQKASESRGTTNVLSLEKKLEPGEAFGRFAGIMAASKGSMNDALSMAKDIFPEEKPLHNLIRHYRNYRGQVEKAPVDVGTTADADYAAPLVYARNMETEFIEFLRPRTIVGQIKGLRRVPFNVRVPRQLTGGSAGWVGEGAPKPVTSITLDMVELKYKKLATIAVISDELARFSSPSASLIIRDALAGAIIQQMDLDFIDPANAGTTNVKPASITNSASAIVSSGTSEAAIRQDIINVFAPFIAANLTPANGVWIMSATTALGLSLMQNPLGQAAFPGISMAGGSFNGMPVVVSEAVGNIVVLANASDILVADDGQVTIDTSREASLQMDSAPTNPPVAATVMVSLWQLNLLGIKAERYIDWVKARPQSVQYLSAVEWGLPTS